MTLPLIEVNDWASRGVDAQGVEWVLEDVTGWDDIPALRVAFVPRPGADGSFDAQAFLDVRVLTWTGTASAPDALRLAGAKARLRNVADDLTSGVAFILTNSAGQRFLTYGKRSSDWKVSHIAPLTIEYLATITCPDPLLYAADEQSGDTHLTDTSLGAGQFRFPLTFPRGFNVDVGAGVLVVQNDGTAMSYPLITITGPGTNLTITDGASGRHLTISSLNAGQFVTLDTRPASHAVLLMGVTPRRDLLTADSQWFGLPEGSDTLTFYAASYTSATVTVAWRDAWA